MIHVHPCVGWSAVLWFVCALSAPAQQTVHPDPAAVPIDTLAVETNVILPTMLGADGLRSVVNDSTPFPDGSGNPQVRVRHVVVIWRTSNGDLDVVLCPASIVPLDTLGLLDYIPTTDLFGQLSRDAVLQMTLRGYRTCQTDCGDSADTSRAFCVSCVERVNSGASTRFLSCDAAQLCARTYRVCCPLGPSTPSVLETAIAGGSCSTLPECESTCAPCAGSASNDLD